MKKDNLIGTIPTLKREWSVSIDIKPTGESDTETNVFRQQEGDGSNKDTVDLPSISFDKKSTKPVICFAIGDKAKDCYTGKDLPKDKFTNVLVRQVLKEKKYVFSVIIDGKEQKDSIKTNENAKEYSDVKIYASDKESEPAKALVKNIKSTNLGRCFIWNGLVMFTDSSFDCLLDAIRKKLLKDKEISTPMTIAAFSVILFLILLLYLHKQLYICI